MNEQPTLNNLRLGKKKYTMDFDVTANVVNIEWVLFDKTAYLKDKKSGELTRGNVDPKKATALALSALAKVAGLPEGLVMRLTPSDDKGDGDAVTCAFNFTKKGITDFEVFPPETKPPVPAPAPNPAPPVPPVPAPAPKAEPPKPEKIALGVPTLLTDILGNSLTTSADAFVLIQLEESSDGKTFSRTASVICEFKKGANRVPFKDLPIKPGKTHRITYTPVDKQGNDAKPIGDRTELVFHVKEGKAYTGELKPESAAKPAVIPPVVPPVIPPGETPPVPAGQERQPAQKTPKPAKRTTPARPHALALAICIAVSLLALAALGVILVQNTNSASVSQTLANGLATTHAPLILATNNPAELSALDEQIVKRQALQQENETLKNQLADARLQDRQAAAEASTNGNAKGNEGVYINGGISNASNGIIVINVGSNNTGIAPVAYPCIPPQPACVVTQRLIQYVPVSPPVSVQPPPVIERQAPVVVAPPVVVRPPVIPGAIVICPTQQQGAASYFSESPLFHDCGHDGLPYIGN